MNKVTLKGRLTNAPELKTTASGVSVCDFAVAVNRRFNKEQTDFINCQAWRQTAEFITKYFGKGQEILVNGELHIDKYEKDGETKFTTRVVVDEVEFCGSKSENKAEKSSAPAEPFEMPQGFEDATDVSDDLPF